MNAKIYCIHTKFGFKYSEHKMSICSVINGVLQFNVVTHSAHWQQFSFKDFIHSLKS